MNSTFSFKSSIKDIQNRVLSQNIREISNIEQLNSEEAIRNVLKSYTDRFQALGGMLIDVNNFVAKSKQVIKVGQFNDLFEGIYIDLLALYSDLDLVDQVLNLNLQRNKSYFLNIKKRIRDLWYKLNLTRSYIYDTNPTDESYYESFFTDINSTFVDNILIDKKNGYMYLAPINTNIQNSSHLIKNITTTTYPVRNDNAGIEYTTNELNTYEYNYKYGSRDMLENGLWKEELLLSDIPSMLINIGTTELPIKRNYKGIVSIIDIEYTYPVEFNRIDFDLFGDKSTTIDAILYKEYSTDNWQIIKFENDDPLLSKTNIYDSKHYAVRGTNIDVLTFYNIQKVTTKYLRLVVNQNNYEFLDSNLNKNDNSIQAKIQKDLEERRYELIQFDSNLSDIVSTPINDQNTSLYNTIMSIIESTSNIETILTEIEKLILPQINVVNYDFTSTIKFEIGLWSVEPKLEKYTPFLGKFNSINYSIKDKALISASITTKQTTPGSTTCNWYLDVAGKNIPIVENNKTMRKEPLNVINMKSYPTFSDWAYGTFVLLDFPVDPHMVELIGMYTNGTFSENITSQICFLNSRLLYFPELKNAYGMNYVLRYPCAIYNTVNLYVLTLKSSAKTTFKNIPFGIISTNKDILTAFIKSTYDGNGVVLSENYIIVNTIATKEEAQSWFGENFSKAIFIAKEIEDILTLANNYQSIISLEYTKLSSTYSDALLYINGTSTGNSNLSILSTIDNIAPLSNIRNL